SNDTEEASQRYRKFDIQELLGVAARSIGSDATRCTA
ncbi:phosphotransferase family protein, partial [Aspergillus arachidicola]